ERRATTIAAGLVMAAAGIAMAAIVLGRSPGGPAEPSEPPPTTNAAPEPPPEPPPEPAAAPAAKPTAVPAAKVPPRPAEPPPAARCRAGPRRGAATAEADHAGREALPRRARADRRVHGGRVRGGRAAVIDGGACVLARRVVARRAGGACVRRPERPRWGGRRP